MDKAKYIEYYFNSSKYNKEEIIQNLNKEIKNYPGKEATINVELNQWGVYVAKLAFYNKKSIFNFTKNKTKSTKLRKNKIAKIEKYQNRTYGEYKNTTTYKPCNY